MSMNKNCEQFLVIFLNHYKLATAIQMVTHYSVNIILI